MKRPIEDDDVELRRGERQGVEVRLHGNDRRVVVTDCAEPIRVILDRIDSHDTMTERREAIRKPSASRSEIEHCAWLARPSQHVTQQVTVGFLAHTPIPCVGIVGRNVGQQAEIIRRLATPAFAFADDTGPGG